MDLKKAIIEKSESYFDEIVNIRRHLHMHPELSYEEHHTAAFIEEELKKIGLSYKRIYNTGLTGILQGNKPGRTIALRADIDALPVQENTQLPFASNNPGKMHACGHDVHTASLLGTLKILNDLKGHFEGTVKYIFQPAEEKLPGGAQQLIKEGVLENPKPELILGQHVYPDLPAGTLGFRSGPYMASTDEVYLTIKGKGGHGAMPHKINDTVLLAAQIITTLHESIPRMAPATIPTVLSFGKVEARGATNVIPDTVHIEGTFRTMNEQWRQEAHQKIRNIASSLAHGSGADCKTEIKKGYPVLINDKKITPMAVNFAKELMGKQNIHDLEKRMTAEDFAYYVQEIPGVFYRLGTGNPEKGINAPLHSSHFMVDEEALKTGMSTMGWLTIKFLKQTNE